MGCKDPDGRFALSRAVGIWLTLVAVESVHGVIRRLFLEPQLGDLRARQVSVFTGAALIAFSGSRLGGCGRNR